MLSWEFHSFDAASGAAKGQLPLASWEFVDRLNQPGSFRFTLAPPESAAHARYLIAATEAVKTFICASSTDDEGVTRADYTAWVPPGGARLPELAGGGMLSYFDRRVLQLGATRTFTATEQVLIPATVLSITPGIHLDYLSAIPSTGVARDASWTPGDAKIVGEILREIAGRINGFDFSLGYELDAGSFVRRYRTFYPRRGAGATPIFTYGGNMLTLPAPNGNPDFATETVAVGVQTNPTTNQRLVSVKTNADLVAAGYPIVDIRLDRNDIITQGSLDDTALGELHKAEQALDEELVFEVNPSDPVWKWGSWDLGADCYVEVPAGTDPWRPDGLSDYRRIVEHRWSGAGPASRLAVVAGRRWEGP